MQNNGVIIVSGGMDSITLLHDLHNRGLNLKALSFDYGQRHLKELNCASNSCEKLKIEHQIINLKSIKSLISNSALTGHICVPEGHYEYESMKLTVVPNRNMIMLSIAIGYAENLGYNFVYYGAHSGDHAIYPDCRPEFIDKLSEASKLGTYNQVTLLAPYKNITKSEIALIGLQLGINYELETWTCYNGRDFQCGKCGSCVERLEALHWARNEYQKIKDGLEIPKKV